MASSSSSPMIRPAYVFGMVMDEISTHVEDALRWWSLGMFVLAWSWRFLLLAVLSPEEFWWLTIRVRRRLCSERLVAVFPLNGVWWRFWIGESDEISTLFVGESSPVESMVMINERVRFPSCAPVEVRRWLSWSQDVVVLATRISLLLRISTRVFPCKSLAWSKRRLFTLV